MGPVYRAYDAQRERLVAVKLFQLDLAPERAHRLVEEFEQLIAAELTHPALAAPVATGLAGASVYLARDYVAAESLDQALREYGPAPPADALRVAAHVAGALDFAAVVAAHHGALHPRDLLLSTEETRLTGIGIARALERVGAAVPIRRPYTPPERIAGAPWDRRADVFSLAALVYELMCGKRITGTGMQAIEAMTALPGAHLAALQSAFARALAQDPGDRFETALEFADALKEAFSDAAIAPPIPAADRDSRAHFEASDPSPVVTGRGVEPAPAGMPLEDAAVAAAAEAVDLHERGDSGQPAPSFDLPRVDLHPESPAMIAAAAGTTLDSSSRSEPARSALWPLLAALVIGLALGFAGGYGVGSRDRALTSASAVSSVPLESTEVAVARPQGAADGTGSGAPVGSAANMAGGAGTGQTPELEASKSNERRQAEPLVAPSSAPTAAAAPDRPAAIGSLLVRSTPDGARVIVDGHDAGRTPAEVRDLTPGGHSLRIQHDGYVTVDRRVTISDARPTRSMTVALEAMQIPAPGSSRSSGTSGGFNGGLSVESRPSGARIYLDGRLMGTTPLSLSAVQAGEHTIRLERDGYRRWSSLVRVVSAEKNRVTASLEK